MIAILAVAERLTCVLIGTSEEVATQLEEQFALIDRWGWGHGLILKLTVALGETSADLSSKWRRSERSVKSEKDGREGEPGKRISLIIHTLRLSSIVSGVCEMRERRTRLLCGAAEAFCSLFLQSLTNFRRSIASELLDSRRLSLSRLHRCPRTSGRRALPAALALPMIRLNGYSFVLQARFHLVAAWP
jgi:hypothetical protein